jgi:prevent-host-death family protein
MATKRVNLREAKEQLSRYVAELRPGDEIVITKRGDDVARLVPVERGRNLTAAQMAARERTRARMAKGWPIGAGAGSLDRNALHER